MSGKKILLYYPPNNRSVAIETLCLALKEGGHEVIVLTFTEKGPFHERLEAYGIQTFTHVLVRKNSWKYFYKHARYLAKFCKQHKIDEVWSHLQEGNIVTILARPFLKAKVVNFRHHAESAFYAEMGGRFGMKRNRGEVLLDKIINRFAKKIVVPSSGVWYGMEKYEHCNMKKVLLLPYIYDFTAYPRPDEERVIRLRKEFESKLLLIMVSRMIVTKQHKPVFEAVNRLVKEGLSVKMIVMDDGVLKGELEQFIRENNLTAHIHLVGFRQDFVNYMMAADLLMHPSVTEASNNVVKEMGLLEKGVAVCPGVGDFNDYIRDHENGYFLSNANLSESAEGIIRDAYEHKDNLKRYGAALKKDVLKHFSDSLENRDRFLGLLN